MAQPSEADRPSPKGNAPLPCPRRERPESSLAPKTQAAGADPKALEDLPVRCTPTPHTGPLNLKESFRGA